MWSFVSFAELHRAERGDDTAFIQCGSPGRAFFDIALVGEPVFEVGAEAHLRGSTKAPVAIPPSISLSFCFAWEIVPVTVSSDTSACRCRHGRRRRARGTSCAGCRDPWDDLSALHRVLEVVCRWCAGVSPCRVFYNSPLSYAIQWLYMLPN
jgi:hypothetical protein